MGFTLFLARGWYLLLGAASILATLGNVTGAMTGSNYDWWLAVGGVVLGLLAIAAGLFVESRGRLRAAATWLGIVGVAAVFGYLLWTTFETARDAIGVVAVPAAVAFLAAARMAWARARALTGDAGTAPASPPAPADPAA